MNNTLSGRVAVITGASSGIGEAVARTIAAAGGRVVINARRAQRLQKLADDINKDAGQDRCATVAGDAADETVVNLLLETARQRFGPPNLVVVNAGRGLSGSLLSSDAAQWEDLMRTNVAAAGLLMRLAAKAMIEHGPDPDTGDDWLTHPRDIVVLGSTVGKHISPFSSFYGASKFAVGSWAEALRREVGPKGIRVTLVAPGVVKSEFQQVAGYDPNTFGEFMQRIGPVPEPQHVADAIAYTCSLPANIHINDFVIRATRQDYP